MKRLLISTATVLLGTLCASAYGQTATANIDVSATVPQSCTIAASAIAFGTYDPVGTNATNPIEVGGTLDVTCTRGSSGVTIELSPGANLSGTRRMRLGATSEYLAYELYKPSGTGAGAICDYTTPAVWGLNPDHFTPGVTWAANAAQTFNVCGQVPAGQDAAASGAGSYTDLVVATVNF